MNLRHIFNNYFKGLFLRSSCQNETNENVNILIDGIICMENVSIYYISFLLILQAKLNKRICVYLAIDNKKNKYHINNRIFTKFFPTKFLQINYKKKFNEENFLKFYSQKSLFDCEFQKNIYSGFVRINQVGTCDVNQKSYKNFFYNWAENFLLFDSKLSKLNFKYLLITDTVYHHFGLLFKTALKNNIKVIATIPYDQSGLIGGRYYIRSSDYYQEKRNYILSFNDKTLNYLRNKIDFNKVEDFVKSRLSGNQKIFDGNYHKKTSKMSELEINNSLNSSQNFSKKILIACHLLWDDSNSSYTTLYNDYEIWLNNTIDCAINNSNVLWIFKAHPSEIYLGTKRTVKDLFIEKKAFNLPNVILLEPDTKINTYSLIQFVDAIITVKGTIGFEAAMLGKGVISAGTNAYSELGLSFEFSNSEEYEYFLKYQIHNFNLQQSKSNIELAKLCIYIYLVKKCPQSNFLRKITNFKLLTREKIENELFQDKTILGFVNQILNNENGDLL